MRGKKFRVRQRNIHFLTTTKQFFRYFILYFWQERHTFARRPKAEKAEKCFENKKNITCLEQWHLRWNSKKAIKYVCQWNLKKRKMFNSLFTAFHTNSFKHQTPKKMHMHLSISISFPSKPAQKINNQQSWIGEPKDCDWVWVEAAYFWKYEKLIWQIRYKWRNIQRRTNINLVRDSKKRQIFIFSNKRANTTNNNKLR